MTTDIDKLAADMREAAKQTIAADRAYARNEKSRGAFDTAIAAGNSFGALASTANVLALLDDRDRLQEAVKEAVATVSNAARAQGEAEGRLRVSETAGIIEGWREHAERAEAALTAKERECEGLREALLIAAPSHQGGKSESGAAIAEALVAEFPLRMPDLVRIAQKYGLDPAKLWPWLSPSSLATSGGGND